MALTKADCDYHEEINNAAACRSAAAKQGHSPLAADNCNAGELNCPSCPLKNKTSKLCGMIWDLEAEAIPAVTRRIVRELLDMGWEYNAEKDMLMDRTAHKGFSLKRWKSKPVDVRYNACDPDAVAALVELFDKFNVERPMLRVLESDLWEICFTCADDDGLRDLEVGYFYLAPYKIHAQTMREKAAVELCERKEEAVDRIEHMRED